MATASPKADALATLQRAQRAFGNALKEYESKGGRFIDRMQLLRQEQLDGAKLYADRYHLLDALPKNAVVAEVGTDRGDFARKILEVADPAMLHVLELDVSRINPDNLSGAIAQGRCQLHAGDSAANLGKLPDASLDWIYIDADHYYEGVKRDIAAALPKVKPGGLMVFNDYTVWSTTSMRHCGVARAANEAALAGNWTMVGFAFQTTMYCDAAFRIPG
jgi:hypothetical protein